MNLTGKRIIVTGVASGIGQQSAKILQDRGAIIVGFDRNEPQAYVDEYIHVELTDRTSINNAVDNFSGNADTLCNIAGVPPTAPAVTVVTVNFIGLRHFTERIIGRINDGGSIVNMASLAGVGWPQAVADISRFIETADFENAEALCEEMNIGQPRSYFFSKEVLIVWTMQNWNTWRDRGIRVNAVSPGPVSTPILGDFLETLGPRAEEDMRVMGRAGKPEKIAPIVAFLCSDESSWLNGANIFVALEPIVWREVVEPELENLFNSGWVFHRSGGSDHPNSTMLLRIVVF